MRIFDQHLSLPKSYRSGTHRSCDPVETMRRFGALMPRLGITRLADVTGLDSIGIPVYMAVRPNARSLSVSQGKGLDHPSARVSALMESIEVWHAEHIRNPVLLESFRALGRNEAVIDVHRLPLVAGAEIDERARRPWIEGYDLVHDERIWVPLELVDLNMVDDAATPTFDASSNGLASGNHFLEAAAHGLTEAIERDASALWMLSTVRGLEADRVDLATVDDPHCRELVARIQRAGVLVGAFDVTGDTGIPTYHALVCEPRASGRNLGFFWGMGAHLEPAVALSRAITEAVQVRLVEISGARDDISPSQYTANRDQEDLAWLEALLVAPAAPIHFRQRRSLARGSFEEDIALMVDALRGLDADRVVVVDLTRPELGVPVAHVMVPGLEGPMEGLDTYRPGPRARRMLEREAAS